MMLPLGPARFTTGLLASAVSVAMLASGCTKDPGSEAGDDGISGSMEGISSGDGDGDETTGSNTSADTDIKFDMAVDTGNDTEDPCGEGGEGEMCDCEVPMHTPCDANANTPL